MSACVYDNVQVEIRFLNSKMQMPGTNIRRKGIIVSLSYGKQQRSFMKIFIRPTNLFTYENLYREFLPIRYHILHTYYKYITLSYHYFGLYGFRLRGNYSTGHVLDSLDEKLISLFAYHHPIFGIFLPFETYFDILYPIGDKVKCYGFRCRIDPLIQ